jgi:hypothetical protein
MEPQRPWYESEEFYRQLPKRNRKRPTSSRNARRIEEREVEAIIAKHSAKFEPLRTKIVKLLIEYGWKIDPDPKQRLYGLLFVSKGDFLFFVETSGFQRLYDELRASPKAWGGVDWLDPNYGALPLPYHLTQWIEDQIMAMTDSQFQQFMKEQGELMEALVKRPSFFEKYGAWLALLLTIGAAAGGVWAVNATIKTTVREEMSSQTKELNGTLQSLDASVKDLKLLIEGDHNTGARGLESRLNNLEGQLEGMKSRQGVIISTDTGSSKPPTTKDDPAKP